MDARELIKSVLQNYINNDQDGAKADFHKYLTLKSKEITGIGETSTAVEAPSSTETQTTEPPASTESTTETQTTTPPATDTQTAE